METKAKIGDKGYDHINKKIQQERLRCREKQNYPVVYNHKEDSFFP